MEPRMQVKSGSVQHTEVEGKSERVDARKGKDVKEGGTWPL